MSQGLSIVGSSRKNGEREKNDFYETPKFATLALLEKELFSEVIWECAVGNGAIKNVLEENGYRVYGSDLIDRGQEHVVDFLKTDKSYFCKSIVTNPPYKHALEFVNKAKEHASEKIAFLLKTTFLESAKRKEMFLDEDFPLKAVYQFSKRISFYKEGEENKGGGMIAYAWFVWDKSHVGKPLIDWI